jgi:hypothetical protein
MASRRLYANAVTQVDEKLTQAMQLIFDASTAMTEERPGDAKTLCEQAEMTIGGAATLAKWATTLLKEA